MISPKGFTSLHTLWVKTPEADKQHFKKMISDAPPVEMLHYDRTSWQLSAMDLCELTMFDAAQSKLHLWKPEKEPMMIGTGLPLDVLWGHLLSNADLMETEVNGHSLRDQMPLDLVRRAKLFGPNGPLEAQHNLLPLFWDRTTYAISLGIIRWLYTQTERQRAAWLDAGGPMNALPEEWLGTPALSALEKVVSVLEKYSAEGALLVVPNEWVPEYWKGWRQKLNANTEPKKRGPKPKGDRIAKAYRRLFPKGHKAAGIRSQEEAAKMVSEYIGENVSRRALQNALKPSDPGKVRKV